LVRITIGIVRIGGSYKAKRKLKKWGSKGVTTTPRTLLPCFSLDVSLLPTRMSLYLLRYLSSGHRDLATRAPFCPCPRAAAARVCSRQQRETPAQTHEQAHEQARCCLALDYCTTRTLTTRSAVEPSLNQLQSWTARSDLETGANR